MSDPIDNDLTVSNYNYYHDNYGDICIESFNFQMYSYLQSIIKDNEPKT